jgi:hypothetical protein
MYMTLKWSFLTAESDFVLCFVMKRRGGTKVCMKV